MDKKMVKVLTFMQMETLMKVNGKMTLKMGMEFSITIQLEKSTKDISITDNDKDSVHMCIRIETRKTVRFIFIFQ